MTPPAPDNLEHQLRQLTTWRGGEPQLWQKALDSNNAVPTANNDSDLDAILRKPLSNRAMLAAAGCVALVCIVGVLLPSLGRPRGVSSIDSRPRSAAVSVDMANPSTWTSLGIGQDSLRLDGGIRGLHQGVGGWEQKDIDGAVALSRPPIPGGQSGRGSIERSDAPARSVIQKATIDLQTPDVRAAFAKASYLVSAAGGEFVENSALTGEGKTAQANLTLRVSASRLSEVLNQLRELGKVTSEQTTGEDVTSQVVDLEARLRNEQRIEKELLELLDKRADAPLKDILELRSSLSAVRQTIEQYIAQRDRLNHFVSLASILVVIRAEPETIKPEPSQSLTTYFVNGISETWHDGLRSLADSVSWLLSLLIRGTLFWLLLVAILVAILRYRRRLAARCV